MESEYTDMVSSHEMFAFLFFRVGSSTLKMEVASFSKTLPSKFCTLPSV
jgi:hypothetical protein